MKRTRISFFLLAAILLLFAPLSFAHALDPLGVFGSIGGAILDGVRSLIETAVIGLLSAFIAVAALLLEFTASILQYVMSPDFNATIIHQPFVEAGWTLTRNFANMFFIVILIIIAFATILRQEQFGIRKTLPTLIIIALFINFSLIFVGFFIDVSQVFMLYFTHPFEDMDLGTMLVNAAKFDEIFTSSPDLNSEMNDWEQLGIRIVIKVLQLFALLFAIFIVTVLAVLFIIRTVILWVVAILAPLAFVAYIMPFSRSMWTKWFSTLINWVIFGPAAMFFLFLAGTLMTMLKPGGPMAGWTSGATAGITRNAAGGNQFLGHGAAFIQAAAVFVFLFLAINAAKSFTGAIGAKVAGKVEGYGRGALGVTAAPYRAARRAARRKVSEEAARRGARPAGWGARTTEKIAAGEHPLGKLPLGIGWAARTAARQARQPLRDLEMRAGQVIDSKQKDLSRNKDTAVIGALDAAVEPMEKIAATREAVSRGILDQSKLKEQDLLAIREEAAKYDRHKEIDIARPDIYKQSKEWKDWKFGLAKKGFTPQQLNDEEEKQMTAHMSKYSPQQAAQLSGKAMADELVQKGIVKGWGSNQAAALVQNGTNVQIGAFEKALRNMTEGATNFAEAIRIIDEEHKNPRLARALKNNPTLSVLDIRPGGPRYDGDEGGGVPSSGPTIWTPQPGGHKLTDEELAERRRTGDGGPPPGDSTAPPPPKPTSPAQTTSIPPGIPPTQFQQGGKYPPPNVPPPTKT